MTIWEALLLGFVQGVSEFLPVSSSGHLLLLQKAFGIQEGGLFFTVMLHLATLAAVCVTYRKLLWRLIKKPLSKPVMMLALATCVTVAFAVLFKKVEPFASFYTDAEAGMYLGYCFLITSILLTASDLFRRPPQALRKLGRMKWTDALIIGGMQGVGVLPGVSRSGSTITGALFAGLDRKAAADFSFLLSIPAILGGAVLEIPDAMESGLGDMNLLCVLAGMLTAGAVGYLAIRVMLKAVKSRHLWGFAVYTALLGIFVILDQSFFHLIYAMG